jgi:hypothetical protein
MVTIHFNLTSVNYLKDTCVNTPNFSFISSPKKNQGIFQHQNSWLERYLVLKNPLMPNFIGNELS